MRPIALTSHAGGRIIEVSEGERAFHHQRGITMRKLAGTDIIDFHDSGYDLLVLTATGEYTHLDHADIDTSTYDGGRANAYDFCTTADGDEVQILLERATITDGDWFPDALDADGNLTPSVAAEMADIITNDGIVPARALKARSSAAAWEAKAQDADKAALTRARDVAAIVSLLGDNQSAAARVLGINQSNVSRLVKRAAADARRTPRLPHLLLPLRSSRDTIDASYEQTRDESLDMDCRVQAYGNAVTTRNTLSLAIRHLSEVARDLSEQYGAELAAGPDDDYSPDALRKDGFRWAYEDLADDLLHAADVVAFHGLIHPEAE